MIDRQEVIDIYRDSYYLPYSDNIDHMIVRTPVDNNQKAEQQTTDNYRNVE